MPANLALPVLALFAILVACPVVLAKDRRQRGIQAQIDLMIGSPRRERNEHAPNIRRERVRMASLRTFAKYALGYDPDLKEAYALPVLAIVAVCAGAGIAAAAFVGSCCPGPPASRWAS